MRSDAFDPTIWFPLLLKLPTSTDPFPALDGPSDHFFQRAIELPLSSSPPALDLPSPPRRTSSICLDRGLAWPVLYCRSWLPLSPSSIEMMGVSQRLLHSPSARRKHPDLARHWKTKLPGFLLPLGSQVLYISG